ncbi:MAG: DNA-directed RNA polymerase subunit N [Candidatus Altiarchaeota archaeon]|nr:DNA-directed RNA polymerase subunit N [Candidatus Altiarchaeota archaeon]
MIIPVRCFSCGFPISAFYPEFKKRVAAGEDAGKVMDEMTIERFCCRRMLLSQSDVIEKIAPFKK